MLVCSFVLHNRTRDRGCSAHPVFPAPSAFRGQGFQQNSGRIAPREREVVFVMSFVARMSAATSGTTLTPPRISLRSSGLQVRAPSLRGALATKQSILSCCGAMDCFRLRSLSFGGQVATLAMTV